MKGVAALALAALALAGCGGGGDGGGESTAPDTGSGSSASQQHLAAWAAAARAYWQDFGDCGLRAVGKRDFYAACTRKTRAKFHAATSRALARSAACPERRRLLIAVRRRLDRAIGALDRRNNAALAHRTYGGPPVQVLYNDAAQALAADVPAAQDARC